MKTLKYISLMLLALLTFTACSDDDDGGSSSSAMVINKVYLEDVDSDVPDREVDFARLGQLIRIEGSGFSGLTNIYINGYDTYFNNALMTDNNVWVTLNGNTPITDADDDVRNTIVLVKGSQTYTYPFTIRAAAPSITSISCTLPQAGETVIVYGSGLEEMTLVTLPDGTEVTDITSDEDGEWFSFVMPEGITEGGSIIAVGANGTAKSPAYFNNGETIILDFDGNGVHGYWSWTETGSMINDEDLATDPLDSGRGLVCQLIPQRLIDDGGVAVKSRCTEVWTAGNDSDTDDWSNWYGIFEPSTPLADLAFQMDIYVPEAWSGTGQIQVTVQNNVSFNGYGSDETKSSTTQTYVWIPWLTEDGEVEAFQTDGWQTVTIPMTSFSKYANEVADGDTPIFQEVVEDRNNGSYRNFGVGFVNTDFTYNGTEYLGSKCSQLIYIDNFRLVPNASFTVSDFDDEE